MTCVYIIENPQGRRYIGCTTDLDQRMQNHHAGISKLWMRPLGAFRTQQPATDFAD